ncbi:MAG: nuclear transport factor 2 family protein [Chitinivorax sp.]|jgi:ketosteroid isomerase-like protein
MSDQRLSSLLAWYAGLTPASLADIGNYYAADAHFRDPFNDVYGVAAIKAIFEHMFAVTEVPRFVFVEQLQQGDQAFVTWRFDCVIRGRLWQIEGSTHLVFGADGRVVEHRDYWDAAEQLYEKLPLIGGVLRLLKRSMR